MNTTPGMKLDTKQKREIIKAKHFIQDNIITNASNAIEQHTRVAQHVQQMQYFHLHDQEPQSMNAKRKLQQLSISLNQQQTINPHRQIRHTLNLLKKKTVDNNHHQHEKDINDVGWTDSDVVNVNVQHSKNIQKRKNSAFNGNRTFHPGMRNSLTKTVNVNSKCYNKRLASNISPDTKLNLTFNNLLSTDIEIIRDQEISKQILSKIKNSQPKRPTTSSYYIASQKILTLFEKDVKQGKRTGQTIRIHSIKDVQVKSNNPLTLKKQRERMLKTCAISSFYVNDKNKLPHQHSQDVSRNTTVFQRKITDRLGSGKKQAVDKNGNHYRTYSQPVESGRNKGKGQSNEGMRLSQRKYQRINDKKTKKCWGLDYHRKQKSQQQQALLTSNKTSTRYYQSQQRTNDHPYAFQRSLTQNSQLTTSLPKQTQLNSQCIPASNSLESDFSKLINLLKDQSQHTFGSQLQAYMEQVKNNQMYNYYMSKGVNRKNTSRSSINQSIKVKREKILKSKLTSNLHLSNEDVVNKNNAMRHYSAFSASKHRVKTNNFLISNSDLV